MGGGDTAPGIQADRADAARRAAQAPPALQPGDRFSFDNPDVSWQVRAVDSDGRVAWAADDGETQITDANPLLPALEWHSATQGNGKRLISGMNQSMFPMEPGREVVFRSTVETDKAPYAWEYDWRCVVGAMELVRVPAGEFPSYRISCGRQQPDELVFYYAPEVGNYVRLIVADSHGGPPTVRRLTGFSRGGGQQSAAVPMESSQDAMAVHNDGDVPEVAADAPQTGTMAQTGTMTQQEAKDGPTKLGMIAGTPEATSPATTPDAVPQSSLMESSSKTDAAPAEQPATETKEAMAPVDPGTVAMHLASYKDPNNAETGWRTLTTANPDILQGMRPIIRKVELGTRGTFYRLHAGPVANKLQAKTLCERLKQRGTYCAVVTLK